jgi:low temperature requirement protein LtrA
VTVGASRFRAPHLVRPMVARSVAEQHRTSTPLELLFDLTFVVAISRAAVELAHAIAEGHLAGALPRYLLVFFAIWWAWMNFTWFASAYDVDDVPYRLVTMVQMAGVLVLATGVPAVFAHDDITTVTVGYVIMRAGMVVFWLRAARSDPERRACARRFALGITVVQVAWILRLFLPHHLGLAVVPVLVLAELAVPVLAERRGETTWHPHHIAERYGLFTIIVLGEGVLAVTAAVEPQAEHGLLDRDLIAVAVGGLLLLFALWWTYFLKPAAEQLDRRRRTAYWWGYGHYGIFAGLAAIGAALEVAAERVQHVGEGSDVVVVAAIAVPVALVVVLVWALHTPASATPLRDGAVAGAVALAVLAVAPITAAGLPLSWAVPVIALLVCVLPGVAAVRRTDAAG